MVWVWNKRDPGERCELFGPMWTMILVEGRDELRCTGERLVVDSRIGG